MRPDLYQISDEDDIPVRVRELNPDGASRIRVALRPEDAYFYRSLPYAEALCAAFPEFLRQVDAFKKEQKEKYFYDWLNTGADLYRECSDEMSQLTIESIRFVDRDFPAHAEINFHEIPSSWRYWSCGYTDGRFYGLAY